MACLRTCFLGTCLGATVWGKVVPETAVTPLGGKMQRHQIPHGEPISECHINSMASLTFPLVKHGKRNGVMGDWGLKKLYMTLMQVLVLLSMCPKTFCSLQVATP